MRSNKKLIHALRVISVALVFVICSVSVYAVYKHVAPVKMPSNTQGDTKKAVTTATKTPVKTVTPVTTTSTKTAPSAPTATASTPASTSTVTTSTPPSAVSGMAPDPASISTTTSTPTNPSTTSSYTSNNWSGYISTGQTYNAISGSWTVPVATGNGTTTSGDGTWIGIGGVTTSDLIQVGTTDTVSASGQASSAAFYELLPQSARAVTSLTVSPGDSITASLNEIAANQWTISISDSSTGQTFSQTVSYGSSSSSAEWIEEDPAYVSGGQVPFDEFGSVTFTNGTTTSGSTGYTIASSGADPVTLVNTSGTTLATPSAIGSDGERFTVTRSN